MEERDSERKDLREEVTQSEDKGKILTSLNEPQSYFKNLTLRHQNPRQRGKKCGAEKVFEEVMTQTTQLSKRWKATDLGSLSG